jgi:hypothetical protein
VIDVGDTVPLSVTITDATGALVNPATIVLTITAPDGTVTTPAPANPSTGVYLYNYVPTMAGRHSYRWQSTGPATAYTDVVNVEAIDPRFIFSLAEARAQLKTSAGNTIGDEELRLYLGSVTAIVEDIVGPQTLVTRTYTTNGGGPTILLHHPPVTIVSVTENGMALTQGSDYVVDYAAGIIYRGTLRGGYIFMPGNDNVVIVYTTGTTTSPLNVRKAAGIILAHLWQADQQGYRPQFGAPDDDVTTTPTGFAIPRRAAELLAPSQMDNMPGFA